MKNNAIFAYGTLMFPPVFEAVAGTCVPAVPAVVEDYQRRAVDREVYPAAVPLPGSRIEGVLFENISDEMLRRIDLFEDVDSELYVRVSVVAHRDGREPVPAYLYEAGKSLQSKLSGDWYPEKFQELQLESYLEQFKSSQGLY